METHGVCFYLPVAYVFVHSRRLHKEVHMNNKNTGYKQQEWEDFVARFQLSDPKASSSEKWQLMDRIFYLYK
ncbi:hypothetical protein FACS189413_15880 [Bacteroidia bacterium]|nr:hypothetical protein FACS189413_15880 [Bacteroidia bacterium]